MHTHNISFLNFATRLQILSSQLLELHNYNQSYGNSDNIIVIQFPWHQLCRKLYGNSDNIIVIQFPWHQLCRKLLSGVFFSNILQPRGFQRKNVHVSLHWHC